jgi:hypothetical protein
MSQTRGGAGRLTSLVILGGLLVAGVVYDTARNDPAPARAAAVEAGVAIPAARPDSTLSSTWFCAGGTAAPGGFADHVLLISNPSDRVRTATITALTGAIAPAPVVPGDTTTSTSTKKVTTTTASTTTSTTTPGSSSRSAQVRIPARGRLSFRVGSIVNAPLAGATVEVDGGDIAVEHEISGDLGRATAPCSSTTASTWSFPWGVTARGDHELLVFMNPFPDDATVDVSFATDEGVRDTVRFRGFIVPGRSVVGAYIDQDVTRKAQVSAKVTVRGGRVVVDRIQTFDGTDGRQGMTIGLGAPAAAQTWMFPDGQTGPGLAEQMVVFNPGAGVAEAEVEVRLDDPAKNGTPEPFELTIQPGRYAIVNLQDEDRIPKNVGHSSFVRSLNGVPIIAERAVAATTGSARRGVSATLGSPLGSPTWYFPGGGPTADRDEFITLLNMSDTRSVTYSITGLAGGQNLPIEGLQEIKLAAGARVSIRLGDHVQRDDLAVVVTADGPIVAERGLYKVGGSGLSQAMGIPSADHAVVPAPQAAP